MEQRILPLVLASSWAFLIAVFAVPSIIRVAHLKNILDKPNLRTMHGESTPRLGGMAMFAGFMSALTIFTGLNNGVQQLLAGCIILFFIGLKDDMITISALKKFAVQVLATGIVMFMGDIRITSFQGIFGLWELELGASYAFTFFVIVGITNAINLIDGLDGLAGTIVLIASFTFGLCFFFYGGTAYSSYASVAFCLIGGVLGFLRYNFHKATIFMGDTGSLLCGFILSVLAIQFIEMRAVPATPSVALGVLFVPLFDTVRVMLIRAMSGKSPFAPDKNHVHHRLTAMGLGQVTTVLVLGSVNTLAILFVLGFGEWGNHYILLVLLVFSAILSALLEFNRLRSAQVVSKV
ncbi:MraY family glycosyltransferase [Pontibacter ummariensis]|nr:MraY family glycosyltransferase [Pontibacter ummariensis]